MFNCLIGLVLLISCISAPAYAQLANNPLANTTWVFYTFNYDARPQYKQPAWHKGVITFNANYTADLHLTDASEEFDSNESRITLKYNINSTGKIDITAPNSKDSFPYIGGQLSKTKDKISAVIKINPAQDGIIMMMHKTAAVSFSNLDLMGEWGGRVFANNGKDGIGWMSFDLTIDAQGSVKGSSIKDGKKSGFSGNAVINSSGQLTMRAVDDQDAKYPIDINGQMSKERTSISFNFKNPHDNGQGIGLMIKK